MSFDKSTCWYDKDKVIANMNQSYDSYAAIWNDLEHIKTFNKILATIPFGSVIDIGCGTSQISPLFKGYNYVGADLEFIINECAKVKHPENWYITVDAETTDWEFISKFDLVLMNGFIDVMEHPLEVLSKVLSKCSNLVWIHRQELSESKATHTISKPSYGGITYHSIINSEDFVSTYSTLGFELIECEECGFSDWEGNGNSILLKKCTTE